MSWRWTPSDVHGDPEPLDNCPFTFARTPGKCGCKGWADRTRRWLKRHPGCVARAVARHRNPARRCSRPRSAALLTDESAVAAQRTDSERVRLIDLSRFMCDDTRCFPVVGGALVIKDIGHLTRTFSLTLGPLLGRAIDRLRGRLFVGRV